VGAGASGAERGRGHHSTKNSHPFFRLPLSAQARTGPDPRFRDAVTDAPRPPSLREIHEFLWNRLRAVARDFTSQNYRATGRNDALALEAHERAVRALVFFNYALTGDASFQWQLNEERLNAFLKTLMELYDDGRKRSIPVVATLESPNVSPGRTRRRMRQRGLVR
jgi:hypothetical protein